MSRYNQVTLQGKIVSIRNHKDYSEVCLLIKEKRKDRDGKTIVNFPVINFVHSDRALLFDFKVNDQVRILSTLLTRVTPTTENKVHYESFLRAEEIHQACSEFEEIFGKKLQGRDYFNQAFFLGTVVKTMLRGSVGEIVLSCDGDRGNIKLTMFLPKDHPELLAKRFPIGRKVCAKCEVSTSRKEYIKDGKKARKDFQNYVVVNTKLLEEEGKDLSLSKGVKASMDEPETSLNESDQMVFVGNHLVSEEQAILATVLGAYTDDLGARKEKNESESRKEAEEDDSEEKEIDLSLISTESEPVFLDENGQELTLEEMMEQYLKE